MTELERLALAVAKTHNGKSFPRHAQIESIKALQDYFNRPKESQDLGPTSFDLSVGQVLKP